MTRFRLFVGLTAASALGLASATISPLSARQAPTAAPSVTVALDGSSDFQSVQAAIDAAPIGQTARFVIAIKPGLYREKLVIGREKGPISFQGADALTTILSFDDFAGRLDAQGQPLGTAKSYSSSIASDDFIAENISFENTHEIGGGVGNQALALSFKGDRGVFRRCRFVGKQDTLYIERNRQYFEDCFIAGQVDFIFGGATAWFERCEIRCVAPGIAIAAPSTPETEPFGYVFSNCKITAPDGATWKTHLGRPWRPFGSVLWLQTEMADIIEPVGWNNWNKPDGPNNEKTARFGEYRSRGAGANAAARAAWSRQLSEPEAKAITLQKVMGNWNPQTTPRALTDSPTAPAP